MSTIKSQSTFTEEVLSTVSVYARRLFGVQGVRVYLGYYLGVISFDVYIWTYVHG
jgi:hypothetical protein